MFFMAIHYPESTLKILDYNRVLRTLNDMTEEQFIERVSESYEIEAYPDGHDPRPSKKGECSMYIGKKWYRLNVCGDRLDHSNLIKMLDS
jgi:uncharacterized protein (DUF1015 family)